SDLRVSPQVDFLDPNEPRHDVALVIDGKKIYANKQYLALHSPVFNAMFNQDFAEKNKKEVELKGVDCEEFLELLHVIYPSYKKITEVNAEYLLKLGDQLQIKLVIDQVEQFLITSSNMSVPDKLKLADQYILVNLQDHCIGSFTTVQDIKKIK
ncbi:hypothetical protein PENTCL1PPCAC_23840, partial [Pristionchus entomophagus]